MARDTITRGPNFLHPEKPSAVGSRNSLNRDGRDEYREAKAIIDEEVDKILNHIHSKLPPEVLEKLDVMGSIKSKLHNYFNQDFQNMLNRYLVTMEDEMGKKFRNLIDKEEYRALNRYTPREVADILDRIGGMDKFNTGEIEKSVVNMYAHLQGHIQRGVTELETKTNALLREKTDVGAFVRGENAYAIVKCSFKDNVKKPKTVVDIKLSINVLDSELISPIYHYQVPVEHIIKDVVSKHIHSLIDTEIEELNRSLMDEGKEELDDSEILFERFRLMENYVSDDSEDEGSKRYQFVAKRFLDAVDGIQTEIDSTDYDALSIRENIKKIIDVENIRNKGFNSAINTLTAILDTSKMGYQHIENYKNARECIIREYEEEKVSRLPDERYNMRLVFLDAAQLKAIRKAYLTQLAELEKEVLRLWDVCNAIYVEDRDTNNYDDWDTLSQKMLNPEPPKAKGWFANSEFDIEEEETKEKLWNEVSFIAPNSTKVNESNPTLENKISDLEARFNKMRDKLKLVYQNQNSETREVVEERIQFIQDKLDEFTGQINPYHVQPGLVLDVDIVSIKRKKTTMMNMANVLNEFLFSISTGFADAAFAGFSRKRSIDKPDIDQEFISPDM